MDVEEKKQLKIPNDRRYGDLIFALNEGCIINPDYFHSSKSVNGMHGYADPKSKNALPLFIAPKKIMEKIDLKNGLQFTDVFPLILKSVNLKT